MTALWQNGGSGWRLMSPIGFSAEEALHDLIEEAPQLLPLAGAPSLAVVGREVQLGSGYADLLAVESSGRPAIIEIKLAKNSEARRAVVAQVLAYAAFLHGSSIEELQRDALRRYLSEHGHSSIADAVSSIDQEGSFDALTFEENLEGSLADGRFRLVIVLDEAPPELVRLVGYLETIGDQLTIDLVTVSAYDVGDRQILVPQRVEPERQLPERARLSTSKPRPTTQGTLVDGGEDFASSIEESPPDKQPDLRRLYEWAKKLEGEGLVTLSTYHGVSGRKTLLPRLKDEGSGLTTIWNENGAHLQVWRSVFERRAPKSIPVVEALIEPVKLGQGNVAKNLSDELLKALFDAYREAVG